MGVGEGRAPGEGSAMQAKTVSAICAIFSNLHRGLSFACHDCSLIACFHEDFFFLTAK